MKLIVLSMFAAVSISNNAQAALSGYYDSAAKIQAALVSSELAEAMKQMPIESLSLQNSGRTVVVQSNGCGFAAHLQEDAPEGLGATNYSVKRVVGPLCTSHIK
jgi:hypothetical protein